jgi:ABC-type transport system involved in multi-copper enzyme maturation permease subunit
MNWPGPVFAWEWLRPARRWQTYAARSAFVALLLAGLTVGWGLRIGLDHLPTINDLANVGEVFFFVVVGTQLAVVLVAAPAAAAGAVCLDRANGSLLPLLVADVSAAQIILGKLTARLAGVLGYVFCALPVLALAILLGGVVPEAVLGATCVTVGVAVLGCSLALTLSVWGRRAHEVLLVNYLFWTLTLAPYPTLLLASWIGLGAVPAWAEMINPFCLAFAPYLSPGVWSLEADFAFLGACLFFSAQLVVVAIGTLRPVALGWLGPSGQPRSRWWVRWQWPNLLAWVGPPLDFNPVLWRDWNRNRPTGWVAAAWLGYALLALVGSAVGVVTGLSELTGAWGWPAWGPLVNALQVSVGMLFVSVTAVTGLAEERARRSMDVLLTTPLPTASIVWGKWWGAYRVVPLLAVLPAVVALAQPGRDNLVFSAVLTAVIVLAYGALLTSLGVALATWVSRPGRAITLSVVAHVLVTVGWMVAITNLKPGPDVEIWLGLGSPFVSVFITAQGRMWSDLGDRGGPLAEVLWLAGYVVVAVGLYVATVKSFDHCLGRVTPLPRPPHPPGRLPTEGD